MHSLVRKNAGPVIATILAVTVTGAIISLLQVAVAHQQGIPFARPYGVLFVIPVAAASLRFGSRFGTLAIIVSTPALIFMLRHDPTHGIDYYHWIDAIPFVLVNSLIVYSMSAARRTTELTAEAREARAQALASEERRQAFSREVLLAVTAGRLMLCSPQEMRSLTPGEPLAKFPLATSNDATQLRRYLRELLAKHDLGSSPRSDDLLTAVTEAATNAVKHAGSGQASVWLNGQNARVLVSDQGHGIQPTKLARATLESGYSSQATLGMGYALMLETVDRLSLCTSDAGTDVLIDVSCRPLSTVDERFLGRFITGDGAEQRKNL